MRAFLVRLVSAIVATLLISAPAHAAQLEAINPTVAHAWSGVAPCLAPTKTIDASIASRLQGAVRGARRIDATVAGFTFRDEPEPLVSAFRQMTKRLPKSARGARIHGDCQDVQCATRVLFGDEAGPRLLLLAVAYRYNASPLGAEVARPWTAQELDELLAAFGDLPPSLFPLEDSGYRALAHRYSPPRTLALAEGKMFALAAVAGERSDGIVVAQAWFKASAAQRRAIIVHELAHEFTRSRGREFDWREPWGAAMRVDDAARAGRGPSIASAYARTNIEEDFAESATAYRYMAPLLKNRAPARYAFLRDWMFDGLEYGAAAHCTPARARSEAMRIEALGEPPTP